MSLSNSFERSGIHSIKLRNLLELRNPAYSAREIRTMFPPIDIGSITLVDQITLLSLIEMVEPKRILEIGTFQGYTTRLFAKNSSAKEILSIDLPPSEAGACETTDGKRILTDGNYNDDYLRAIQNTTGAKFLKDLSDTDKARLKLIKSDSTRLNFDEIVGPIEFAFIDGGHSYEIIKQDTQNILGQMDTGVVVWHDYNSAIHSDVSAFLNDYSKENQLFYVQGGLCAFQIVKSR